ncbi:hypothetical protein P170DRAFT_447484 [Aspergillus steynii IBT 23096]|uniref:Aminoglycoside phosphotransferase domain-containing protein n=1 Tax=Aspergillus steynii IBT 23096 TaxID=1392250 RepID=A0A2I2G3S6_9EURO|nr:uncharacterized protein P170DRAFT_447484 [Aspergillus steynii IBT 23096]PLB47528.1 hypothetical protein P170DRAFT_447484 [Aspergillus steynii IBT 23096]
MDHVPGITYIEAPLTTLRCASWQEQAVSDLARLAVLLRGLPSRFTNAITQILEDLPMIFLPTYPLVLSHADLCEMNIIVNPEAGGINGIIDWADAKVLPFGMSLWGLRNMLGIMDSKGWHYHENAPRLEGLFWETFYQSVGMVFGDGKRAIQVAERAGLLLRYGFTWEDGVVERPVSEQDSSMRYLDAFLPGLEI